MGATAEALRSCLAENRGVQGAKLPMPSCPGLDALTSEPYICLCGV